jgi:sulfur-oxidizing protein SoxY
MTTVTQSEHRPRHLVRRGAWALPLVTALLCTLGAVRADDADQRWAEIRMALFGDRPVADGKDLLQLQTPQRAEDAAVVPVGIKSLVELGVQPGPEPASARHIEDLYLIVDMNPVPLAATFHFPGTQPWDEIATRIRVNACTNVRAVAQTDDGTLYMVANYVKASGGCSAPSLKDPAAAAAQLGLIPAAAAGDLNVQVQDSSGRTVEQRFPVVPSGG